MKKTNQNEPLNRFLETNKQRKPVSFHMPGHKYGRFPYKSESPGFAEYDITEIPGADNIQKPEGIIRESLEMISTAYGSVETMFLTNGATGGILATMKYFSKIGGRILVSRDCHSSVINGAILFRVPVDFIPISYQNSIPLPVMAEDVKKALKAGNNYCAVIITSPNYYGVSAEIKSISRILKSKNILLAVDEAHGAHFKFCGAEEQSGLKSGADIVCHSLHKTMPVYNQGALLHICSDRVNTKELRDIVRMLGTSSPSYPILASMERAVSYFRYNGSELYNNLKKLIDNTKANIRAMDYKVLENDDFTRLVIDVSSRNISGYKALEKLMEAFVYLEACDNKNIIAITSPSNSKQDFLRLEKALETLSGVEQCRESGAIRSIPEKAVDIHIAIESAKHTVSLDRAVGSICGTIIVPYPPGVPCLYPGEVVTGETALYIETIINDGGAVLGLDRGMIPVLE